MSNLHIREKDKLFELSQTHLLWSEPFDQGRSSEQSWSQWSVIGFACSSHPFFFPPTLPVNKGLLFDIWVIYWMRVFRVVSYDGTGLRLRYLHFHYWTTEQYLKGQQVCPPKNWFRMIVAEDVSFLNHRIFTYKDYGWEFHASTLASGVWSWWNPPPRLYSWCWYWVVGEVVYFAYMFVLAYGSYSYCSFTKALTAGFIFLSRSSLEF